MLSKFFAAAALGSALIAAPALAQTSTNSPGPATSTSSASSATTTQNASAAGLWQGSKLIGLGVYDAQNQKIGSIVQLMVDKDGAIKSVVIGVGGFLGMGERDVAVKFSELKWSNEPVPSSSSSSSATPSNRPAGTRSTNSTTGAGATASPKGPTTYPDHAVLSTTKDQLKAMPQFDYNK